MRGSAIAFLLLDVPPSTAILSYGPVQFFPTIIERYRKELRERPIPIYGPEKFELFCRTFLDELKTKAPKRYEEAVGYLPDAYFSSWYAGKKEYEDSYPYFRRLFLYRVWVSIYLHQHHTQEWPMHLMGKEGQEVLEEYSRTVLEEMGVK